MQETYEEFIQNILDTRGRFNCGDEYYEKHHILPKCMGGGNEEENLIDLFAKEHFIVHKLLALENPENEQLVYAWWCMAVQTNEHTKERYIIDAQEYENVRLAYSNMMHEKMSGNNNPMYGISPKERMNEATYNIWLSKIIENSSGENNPMYGKCHTKKSRKKMSESHKGKQIGKNNPFYGRHHSEETKEYLRSINIGKFVSQEIRDKLSEKSSGKNNPKAHPVYCFELNEFFWGKQDVKNRYPSIPATNIGLSCDNKGRICGRHPDTNEPLHWRWATMEEYDNYILAKESN